MTPSKKASAAKKTATVRSRSAGRTSAARPAARKAAVAKVGKAAVPKKAAAKKVVSKRGGGVAKQARRSDVKATTRKANPVHKATTTAATRATPSRNGRQSAPVGSSSGSATRKAVGAKATAAKASPPKKSAAAQGKPATAGAKATKAVTAGAGARTTSTKAPSRAAAPTASGAKSAATAGSGARSGGARGATAAPSAPSAPVTGSLGQDTHGGPTTNGSAAATASETRPSPARPYESDAKFLDEQRQALLDERAVYVGQAADLKAEADSLAADREPGDVQFDEESGEGGTFTVDRERDLALSAQALAAVEEIDAALGRIDLATYGACERCQQPIPKSRLRALPYARLCVACKSGGLSRR